MTLNIAALRHNEAMRFFPYFAVMKSDKQLILEHQGCVFNGQEWLDNHELDPLKPCYCGRPNNR